MVPFFGATAHLAAQGTHDIDFIVYGPTIRAEVKYFPSPARAWANNRDDWDDLLAINNVGNEFAKRAWILFLPSISFRRFANCVSVPKSHGTRFSSRDFAPFSPFVDAVMPVQGINQQLRYKPVGQVPRNSIIQMPGGRRVLAQLVGSLTHPLWAVIYTRVVGIPQAPQPVVIPINDDAVL